VQPVQKIVQDTSDVRGDEEVLKVCIYH